MPTFGSLFAGIGGIDLGLERAGWTGRWQVEYDPFCTRVLERHWPDVTRYGDIKEVDWSGVEPVDLIAGGFPCQPVSLAGQRRIQDDDRWLWPEFVRCLRALRPRLVLVENVPGLLVGGGMDDVLGGLADLGYDAEWESIPAAAVGAPHLRYRVWIVAYPHDFGGLRHSGVSRNGHASLGDDPDGCRGPLADAQGDSSGIGDGDGEAHGTSLADSTGIGPPRSGEHVEPLDPAPGRPWQAGQLGDGRWWATEPNVGRVAHGAPSRVDRLRSLGNAVVPQVVEVIGAQLLEAIR